MTVVSCLLKRSTKKLPKRRCSLNISEKMSNLTFRPRPLDIHKQMPIVRTDADFDYEGVSRSVPQMPTGMDPEDEEEQHIQEAIARSLQPSLQPSEIPTPNCRIVEEYMREKVEPWEHKATFILYNDPTDSDLERQVEYDLDTEDMKFLKELNASKKLLTEDALEFLIDRLEKFKRRCKQKGEANFTVAKAEKLLAKEKHNHNIKTAALAAVFKYWMRKRAKDCALLPRFQKPPAWNDPSPLVAFRPREPAIKPKKIHNRKNDASAFNKLTQLRREFERARMLLEMIKKREKTKRDRIDVLRDIFECKLTEPALDREKKKRRKNATAKPTKRSKIERTYGFDIGTSDSSSSEPPSPIPSSPAPPPVDTPELTEMIQSAPPCPYPVCLGRRLALGDIPPFRGRARIGRGGRLIFDRYAIPWVTLRANGSYPVSEEEWNHAMEEEDEVQKDGENRENSETERTIQIKENGTGDGEAHILGEVIEMEEEEEEDKHSDKENVRKRAAVGVDGERAGLAVRKLKEVWGEKMNGKRYVWELENGVEESSFSKRLREISSMEDVASDDELLDADDELSEAETNKEETQTNTTWVLNSGNGVDHQSTRKDYM